MAENYKWLIYHIEIWNRMLNDDTSKNEPELAVDCLRNLTRLVLEEVREGKK